jgi:hypothetical protein
MIDRLVCADGGNPDPTAAHGKDAQKHLAGRLFATVVHGDAEGIRGVRHALSDWLTSMGLESAGKTAQRERYIGY